VDALEFQRVNRTSRGGDRIVFRDNDWPVIETQVLIFDFPDESEYRRLLNLVSETVGEIITYLDHENKLWSGFIQNPDTTGTQSGRNTWQIPITFEGNLV
jgi:hypothetical protein